MPMILDFPDVIKEALKYFGTLMVNQPERQHLGEYLTGLMVARRKTVSAINRQFVNTTDQSCLNRWLTDAQWDHARLNQMRLDWLQKDPSTRYSPHGVIAIDNVLIDHDGKHIEDVGYFWDHKEQRAKLAHDLLISNYVCTNDKHYPLDFHRFVKEDQCRAEKREYLDHHRLFRQLVDQVVQANIPGDFTFDSWFTCADNLNYIHNLDRGYVGDLKSNRKIVFQGQTVSASQLAGQITPQMRKPVEMDGKKQWYFTKSVRIPEVNHPVRIVILWENRQDSQPKKILVCNRTFWEVSRILRVYRRRWRGTECLHRDGKQHLGMGDCQLRNALGQTRHIYLVFLAHSILMRQLSQNRASAWALQHLNTIGQACQRVMSQTFRDTIEWVVKRVREDDWNCQRITAHLRLI